MGASVNPNVIETIESSKIVRNNIPITAKKVLTLCLVFRRRDDEAEVLAGSYETDANPWFQNDDFKELINPFPCIYRKFYWG